MATKLTDMELEEISLVDNPANLGARIVLAKASAKMPCGMDKGSKCTKAGCNGTMEQCQGMMEPDADDAVGKAMKTEGGVQFPSAAYAYVPDAETPSTWKLRLWETPEKKVTAKQVGMAIAALGAGFRGNKVEIPSGDLPKVKAKVKAAWNSVHGSDEAMPSVLKGAEMTIEERIEKLEADARDAVARAARAEAINKLSPEERSVFDAFGKEDQEKFLSGDESTKKRLKEDVHKAKAKTSSDIEDLRKSNEALAKRLEESERIAKDERDRRVLSEFTKRAEGPDFRSLPGTSEEKGAVLKMLSDSLPSEDVKKVEMLLKAGNEAMERMMRAPGSNHVASDGSVSARIDQLAKARAAEAKISFAKAKDQIFDENPELYTQWSQEEFRGRRQ